MTVFDEYLILTCKHYLVTLLFNFLQILLRAKTTVIYDNRYLIVSGTMIKVIKPFFVQNLISELILRKVFRFRYEILLRKLFA